MALRERVCKEKQRVEKGRGRGRESEVEYGDAGEILRWKERIWSTEVPEWSGLEIYRLFGVEPTAIFKRTKEIFFTRHALRRITARG